MARLLIHWASQGNHITSQFDSGITLYQCICCVFVTVLYEKHLLTKVFFTLTVITHSPTHPPHPHTPHTHSHWAQYGALTLNGSREKRKKRFFTHFTMVQYLPVGIFL